jgi:hypothetical protein
MARRRRYNPSLHPRDKNGRFAKKGTGKILKSRGLSYQARKTGAINRGLTSVDKSRGKNSLKSKINRKPSGRANWKGLAKNAGKATAILGGTAIIAASGASIYARHTATGDIRRAHGRNAAVPKVSKYRTSATFSVDSKGTATVNRVLKSWDAPDKSFVHGIAVQTRRARAARRANV